MRLTHRPPDTIVADGITTGGRTSGQCVRRLTIVLRIIRPVDLSGEAMIIAIVVANVWGVIQVIALGSFARTVRVRTVFAAMAVGLYVCAPLATLLQVAWQAIAAPLLGVAAFQLAGTATYTLDPFVEEILKILPLAVLLMIPVLRRQWSLTDYVLIGAATGAGFGLAENLYRLSASAGSASAVASGWAVASDGTYFLVPSVSETLSSWLPIGASWLGGPRVNAHLVWSAIGGLAVGLTVLNRTTAARLAAGGLFLCIGLDHAAQNATNIASTWLALLATPLAALAHLRGVMPIAALAVAWWLDQYRQRPSDAREPLLAAEQSASSRVMGTLGAAVSRVPWSALSVDRFVRMRRAYNAERASAPAEADSLYALVVSERDRADRELAQLQDKAPPWLPSGWTLSAVRTALRQPAVIIWLVLMTPSVLWFVIGGWPPTARLQAIMMGPVVWKAVFAISVLAQVWLGWGVIVGLRAWPRARAPSIGDDAAVAGLRLACGIGAVALGGFSLMRLLGGLSPGSSLLANLDAKTAAKRMTPAGGLNLANGAAANAPPPRTSVAPDSASAPASAPQADADSGRAAPEPMKAQPPQPNPDPGGDAANAAAAGVALSLSALGGAAIALGFGVGAGAVAVWPDEIDAFDNSQVADDPFNVDSTQAAWEKAEAGRKAAFANYADYSAQAAHYDANAANANTAWEKAKADADAALVTGDQDAIHLTKGQAAAADAANRKAAAEADVARAMKQGSVEANNAASADADAAAFNFRSAAKAAAYAKTQAAAHGGNPDKP